MHAARRALPIEGAELTREVGVVRGQGLGPTLVVVCGIHGNEGAGILAARRVLERVATDGLGLRGELAVFSGNLAALRLGARYQAKDLNRQWSDEQLTAARRAKDDERDPEDRELIELLEVVEDAMARSRGPVYFMDLHTTSAAGIPFVLFGDTLPQRRFGFSFPLPAILGLEEQIDGVLSAYLTTRGCTTLAIEGGQHDDPASIDNLAACLWVALVAAGLVDRRRAPHHDRSFALLESRRGPLPPVIEVTRRWAITPEDRFSMTPGFANIDRVRKGQLLARDARGEIRAEEDGMVILPLYQGLGSDGFFWGRAIGRARLTLAERARRLRLDRLLPLLPGVRRDPADPDRLRADARVSRLYPRDLFHALGYRRIRERGRELLIARQPQ